MKRNGSYTDLVDWYRINMENTQQTIINLNIAIHNLRMAGKDDFGLKNTLRMAETYLKKYLEDQEDDCAELIKTNKPRQKTTAKIYQLKKLEEKQ